VTKRDHEGGQHGGGHHAGGQAAAAQAAHAPAHPQQRQHGFGYARLEDCDLTLKLSKDEEAKRLGMAQRRLLHLRLINGGQLNEGQLGPPVCIVFEGWDAAGKGGAIKRLVEPLDPRHVQWRRAYQEIKDFEHTLAEEGMIVIKLWLHMSHEEQLRRFVRRRDDPLKRWKLTDEDWRNRERRGEYNEAVADMLRLTDGPLTHWDVISAENKRFGRVQVIETVIRRMEEGMERWGVQVPPRGAEEERTELALVFDDAEFGADPAAVTPSASDPANGSEPGSDGRSDSDSDSDADSGAHERMKA